MDDNLTVTTFLILMLVFIGMGYCLGWMVGSNRQLKQMLPELHELRETVSRLRLLSKLQICSQCDGQQNVYNRITEGYQPCSVCKGKGEVRHV